MHHIVALADLAAEMLAEKLSDIRFVIHDRDAKFTGPFDEVFRSEGAEVIRTPIRAPNANAHVERLISTLRRECLDWTLVRGRRHLDRTFGPTSTTTTGTGPIVPSVWLSRSPWPRIPSQLVPET